MINYSSQPDYFKINGVSSITKNVWCNTLPAPPIPKKKVEFYSVGAEENAAFFDDEYEDISYKIVFFSFDNNDYSAIQAINTYILGAKALEISRLSGVYFKVKDVSVNVDTTFQGKKVKFTATFKLSPFKYSTTNEEMTLVTGVETILTNNGTIYSRPIIEVSSNTINHFIFNGDRFSLTPNVEGQTVIIDSERMITYDKDTGSILQGKTSGLYPMLNTGDNQYLILLIVGEGAYSNVKLWKNERYL